MRQRRFAADMEDKSPETAADAMLCVMPNLLFAGQIKEKARRTTAGVKRDGRALLQ